jgi:hypothetical protein
MTRRMLLALFGGHVSQRRRGLPPPFRQSTGSEHPPTHHVHDPDSEDLGCLPVQARDPHSDVIDFTAPPVALTERYHLMRCASCGVLWAKETK